MMRPPLSIARVIVLGFAQHLVTVLARVVVKIAVVADARVAAPKHAVQVVATIVLMDVNKAVVEVVKKAAL